MTAVSVQDLTKDFGDFRAVDGVSFDAPPGAVTGFVGANGSGKTTTMRMMLGLCPPTSGMALFDGVPYLELDKPRRSVGAVVDRIGAHPGHTARRHLTAVALSAGIPTDRVDAALTEVGLIDVADKQIKQFSMGMTQRCALAGALLGSPSVLILDEPANGLDPGGIRWLRTKTRGWADEGKAVIVSTHQLAELATIVDHIVVLHHGRVAHQGLASGLATQGASLEDAVFDLLADLESSEQVPA